MLRSPASGKDDDRQKLLRQRHALSASISADALLVHEEQGHGCQGPGILAITDHSPPSKLPTSPTLIGPLSNPRSQNKAEFSFPSKMLASSASTSSSLESYAERLEQAENTELFTYTSALCYRVTGRYLPRSLLQSDPEAQQRELERIQRDPEILRAIDSVRGLSAQFKEVAQTTMGHRKELGHRLFRIEESYLKLFEKLLELSLRLYWEYERRAEAQRREDQASIEGWRDKYERKCIEHVTVSKTLEAREIIHRAREIELRDLQDHVKDIEKEVKEQRELEAHLSQLQHEAAMQRVQELKLQDEFDRLTKAHDEMVKHQKQVRDNLQAKHKQLVHELRSNIREKDLFISNQKTTLRQLEEIVSAPPIPHETHSSQTEVDDDGLWNVQDGIPRFVSKSVVHQLMWRRFNAFVACKNCRGRPFPKAAKTYSYERSSQDVDSEELEIWSIDKGKKRTKKVTRRLERIEKQWELPSHIVLFLSNLPKSVVAFPFYSLEQVILQIETIYDDKFASDRADEADGVAREELSRFICEYFLKTHGLRQSAEVGLYRFLVSVKNCFQDNSHVRLFARFTDLLKTQEMDSDDDIKSATTASGKKDLVKATQLKSSPTKHQKCSGYLDRSFLHVFLEARYYLLRPPPRVPRKGKTDAEQESVIVEHVVQVEATKKWVPLNHAIAVLRWYSSCLPEESSSHYCRQVEHSTAIYNGHTLTEIAGNRLAVRAEMRRVMLASETPGVSSSAPSNESQQPSFPSQIVADVHTVLSVLMDALEQRHEGIKKDLTMLFDAGDLNHDRVLTLYEFSAIIRNGKPHFSDRRILRMFREALMGGADQSFALSMEAFVNVCNDHGLVSLLPDDRMVDPFALPQAAAKKLLSKPVG